MDATRRIEVFIIEDFDLDVYSANQRVGEADAPLALELKCSQGER